MRNALLFVLLWSAAAMPPLSAAALDNVETVTTDDGMQRIHTPGCHSRFGNSSRPGEKSGETSYYVRVTQADGQQAWSSPIRVTH